jgi:pimeloyl-ACP methyl ester carboxylesterase
MLAGIAALIVVLVLAPLLFTAIACRSLIYHPTQLSPKDVDALAAHAGWEKVRVEVGRGVRVVGLVRAPEKAGPWLLFFGGNAADLEGNQSALELIRGPDPLPGLAVFAYRGYDGSEGRPTERALEDDAEQLAKWLEKTHGVAPSRLIVMGQSLGTGIATSLAARLSTASVPPLGLVLISPYTSMAKLFEEHAHLPIGSAVRDPFRTDRIIQGVRTRILMIHGEEDTLIPPEHAKALAAIANPNARVVIVPKRGHNDMWSDAATNAEIKAFVLSSSVAR